MRQVLMIVMAAIALAALLAVTVYSTDFNPDSVGTIVSLQVEDTADFGDQLVMERPNGEKPSTLYSVNPGTTINAIGDVFAVNIGQILNKGLPNADTGQHFANVRLTSATSQGEVDAHPGNIKPILG